MNKMHFKSLLVLSAVCVLVLSSLPQAATRGKTYEDIENLAKSNS